MSKNNNSSKLSFFNLYTMVVGMVIGAGIFTMLTEVVGSAGRSLPIAVTIGAVLALINVIPSVFLASTVKLSGGNYSQGLALLPPGLAGINGIVKRVSTFGFSAYTLGMASYTLQLVPDATHLQKIVSFIYLVLFFLMGLKGTKGMAKIQDVMTICLFLALGVFIFGGLPAVQPGYFEPEGFFAGGTSGFLYATAMLSMSSMGASGVLSFSAESKNPKKNIPLAMITGTISVAAIYFVMAMVTAGVLPPEEVQGTNLGFVAEAFLSRPLYLFFIVGGALFAMGTSLNGLLASTPQPWEKMAQDGWIPKFFLLRDKRFDYPYVIFGIHFVIGGLLPLVLDLNIAELSAFFSFPNYLLDVVLAFATLRIPKLYPELWKKSPFHVPTPVFVILTLCGAGSALFLTYQYIANIDATLVIGMFIVMALCSGYIYYRYKRGYVNIEEIKADLMDTSEDAMNS